MVKVGEDIGRLGGPAGEYTYARWFDRDELADVDVRTVAISGRRTVQPLMDELVVLATGEEPPAADDPLLPLVNEFLRRGYPTRPTRPTVPIESVLPTCWPPT